ncbi:TPA: winged helix-turn-helix transcriptional regulator [Aeromonas dhakensis]|uniref:Winged helix-turn-helix domain-containing protein n=1 Tax=Aeromonas bestiarum TaxID=105751 RepID=A0ABT7Q0N0_9GAMM|nr:MULTISPECIES: winged helix-turn-helix domain-containing protein [Aeromonas]MCH7375276.1 winged helix-turn-helix domain-containing protein [Aeromonas sp. MR19]MCR3903488.1 winged helix-turn-helix domain-containing protein [Aeromonas hydrophila]MDM5072882.1 winged helix-turn-helix domain-containing protein [Aeromonas bestiarum]HDX8354098.1 winged helix-turn-helix transcriptional regulator [Aeromonas dhakensis]
MEPDIAYVASLIGDKARSRMLTALMGGKALTATELALEGEITAQTASSHLGKLVEGGLLSMRKQGRHRYFQLSDPAVAEVIERMLTLSVTSSPAKVRTGPRDPHLRQARICYDHLAGELGVRLFDALQQQGLLEIHGDDARLSQSGEIFFTGLGVNLSLLRQRKRPMCKACLDWSERRSHLAGTLGQWILDDALAQRWFVRRPDSRVIDVSDIGAKQFAKRYGAS